MKDIKTYISIVAPIFVVFSMAFVLQTYAIAVEIRVDEEAGMFNSIESSTVDRVEVLEKFFEKYDSPLAGSAATFITVADKYDMDYRLLPAISCLESGCGRVLIPDTYNAWGWGIYGDQYISFESWDNGIEEVGKGIYKGYVLKGLDTPAKMAPVYTPPRPQHWLNGVSHFMSQMDDVSNELADASV